MEEVHTSFVQLPDGSLVEQLFQENRKPKVFFGKYNEKDDKVSYHNQIELDDENLQVVKKTFHGLNLYSERII